MSLFIAQTDGTTTFEVGTAEVDMISMSLQDTGLGFSESATQVIEGVTTIPVTYAQTQSGPTADRLNALVNTIGYTAPPDIIVVAVNDTFVLSDGTSLKGNGVALHPGETGNPFAANVSTFYDTTLCAGAGITVDAEGGGTTTTRTDEVLYHELSHCFHFVTGTEASTGAQEEQNAETDENLMRDVHGDTHRDVTSHNGSCGGGVPSCCVVASLSTGSPHSSEVSRFRRYREHTLRGSDVGDDFFARFHHGYYAFSPEVVRLLGRTPGLSDAVRERYVVPLLAAVELLIHYADERGEGLEPLLAAQLRRPGGAEAFSRERIARLRLGLERHERAVDAPPGLEQAVGALAAHIRSTAAGDAMLRWALVDIVELWAGGMLMLHDGEPVDAVLGERIASWLGRMPISPIWESFSRLKAREELTALDQFLFNPAARTAFANRLGTRFPEHGETATEWAHA